MQTVRPVVPMVLGLLVLLSPMRTDCHVPLSPDATVSVVPERTACPLVPECSVDCLSRCPRCSSFGLHVPVAPDAVLLLSQLRATPSVPDAVLGLPACCPLMQCLDCLSCVSLMQCLTACPACPRCSAGLLVLSVPRCSAWTAVPLSPMQMSWTACPVVPDGVLDCLSRCPDVSAWTACPCPRVQCLDCSSLPPRCSAWTAWSRCPRCSAWTACPSCPLWMQCWTALSCCPDAVLDCLVAPIVLAAPVRCSVDRLSRCPRCSALTACLRCPRCSAWTACPVVPVQGLCQCPREVTSLLSRCSVGDNGTGNLNRDGPRSKGHIFSQYDGRQKLLVYYYSRFFQNILPQSQTVELVFLIL
ncbi:hypothetical protein AVEN_221404-1 [Araneus ventricosus]|uniref:Uncharacterized protein n=1 Tax=Araneus ventricosus TaxID=182803 RepID=A0A4Y2DKJ8_ARAVE|nr:hypothetical protein AVEN_221404-1 [Araneus ventricosus]